MLAPDKTDFYPTSAGAIHSLADRFGTREMIIEKSRRATFADVEKESSLLARALLKSGAGKGSRVAFLFPNGVNFVVAFFAITRIGAVAVPVNTFSKASELAWQLRHSDAQILITTDRVLTNDFVERLEQGLPGLASNEADMATGLQLPAAPYLRRIVVHSYVETPRWAIGFDAFEEFGSDVDEGLLAAVEGNVTPADLLCILYTSGSSASPKGVVHTHGGLLRRATGIGRDNDGITSDDIVYNPSPFFWTGGFINGLLSACLNGASFVTEDRFDPPQTLSNLEKEHVTIAVGWPHFAQSMREEPRFADTDLSALRGGILAPLLKGESAPKDPGLTATGIGMTETAGHHTYCEKELLPEYLRGAYGKPAPGVEQIIVDVDTGEKLPDGEEGELCIRGYSVMHGYNKKEREEVFRSDGFFPTGDLGVIQHRFYFFTGRKGDMVKTAGANVSPAEVRNAALEIDGVMDCFVTGLPDPKRGQIVAAAVVMAPKANITKDLIRQKLKLTLSSFKVPKRILLLTPDEIPVLPTDKVDRRALVEKLNNLAD